YTKPCHSAILQNVRSVCMYNAMLLAHFVMKLRLKSCTSVASVSTTRGMSHNFISKSATHTHELACTHTHTSAYTHTRAHTHTHTQTHKSLHAHTHTHR